MIFLTITTALGVKVLAFVLGFYEVLVRIVPSVGNYSLIHLVIVVLKAISDFLNNKKKEA